MRKNTVNKSSVNVLEALPGIYRKTLIYNDDLMLCHFILKKNYKVHLHSHNENQIGYVIKGKLRFFNDNEEFMAEEGDSYVFKSNEKHGADILEDSEVIDVFNPSRDDYK